MTRSVSRSLTQWKHCSLWIDITGNSVHNTGANVWICLVYEFITSMITHILQQTYLIELERGKQIRYQLMVCWRNFVWLYENSSVSACQWCEFGTVFGLRIRKCFAGFFHLPLIEVDAFGPLSSCNNGTNTRWRGEKLHPETLFLYFCRTIFLVSHV